MKYWISIFLVISGLLTVTSTIAAQAGQRGAAPAYNPPRTPDGKPNMQGYWNNQAGAAPWDIEPHPASFQIPAGPGVIVDPADKKIPYKPEALRHRNELQAGKAIDDPQAHCAPSGLPRQTYTPFGFQIVQPPGYFVILYEAEHVYRAIPTDGRPHIASNTKLWMGDSVGHWEGNTLVVDTTNFNGKTWLDMMGNFTSDTLHVVERYTPTDANTIQYEATVEDPTLYTRKWTMAFALRRNAQQGYYVLEFACHEGERDLQHYIPDAGAK